MIRVLADSGSTKTDWIIKNEATGQQLRWQTRGINPSFMNDTQIIEILVSEVRPKMSQFIERISEISKNSSVLSTKKSHDLEKSSESLKKTSHVFSMKSDFSAHISHKFPVSSQHTLVHELSFYGSGCRPEQCERMQHLLSTSLSAENVYVASDLLGAARALCGTQEGIICILGTGSASAHYDGSTFVQSTPSLGYILGDEGSGTSLGKHLLSNVLKQQLPECVCDLFRKEYPFSVAEIIQSIYREPNPNRFMAQFTHFLSKHLSEPSVEALVVDEFSSFFARNILVYQRPELEINFIGSVAAVFSSQLHQAASLLGLKIGQIAKAPLDAKDAFSTMFHC